MKKIFFLAGLVLMLSACNSTQTILKGHCTVHEFISVSNGDSLAMCVTCDNATTVTQVQTAKTTKKKVLPQ